MFKFNKFPDAEVAVLISFFTQKMDTFLHTTSPSGFREGEFVYFNNSGGTALQDASDFINAFADFSLDVEARPKGMTGERTRIVQPPVMTTELSTGVLRVR